LRFDGTITDDGVGDKWKGEENKYRTFVEYQKLLLKLVPESMKQELIKLEQEMIPFEFRETIE
jgi:hypothetical protein